MKGASGRGRLGLRRAVVLTLGTATIGTATIGAPPLAAQSTAPSCNLPGSTVGDGFLIGGVEDGVSIEWAGTGSTPLRLLVDPEPGGSPRLSLLTEAERDFRPIFEDVGLEFRIVEGFRRISNQQLAPLRDLGVEITPEVVDRYKWDVFWDAPLDHREEVGGGNPPPADGVADQPGLPRSPDEVRRATIEYGEGGCSATIEGGRASVTLSGITLGSFEGQLVLTVYRGTNLIRAEVRASTEFPSVAYKYDVGLTGLASGPASGATVHWRDLGGAAQSFGMGGRVSGDPVVLRAANRLMVGSSSDGAIAAFPPPHTFFWAREIEVNVGYNWYRQDADGSYSFGIRQGEEEAVEQYLANWSLYSAPPGTEQRMAAYFLPVAGGAETAFADALRFTNGDVYRQLDGYRVMGSHYHTNLGRELMDMGTVDARLPDFEVLRAAGIEIAGPVDRPRDATQLEEQWHLFEGAARHSDDSFVVLPEMENSNLLGGHWDLLFSHPVYYVDERAPGSPLLTEHPEYGRVYNIGSADDMMAMIEAEDMLVYMPHPRTKGSTGYPDAIADSPQFLSDWYRGVGWRWGMGSDLSERRLSDKRVIPLLDDMNNWIADTDLEPKSLLAITETYFKAPGDDIYANGPVTYLRMDELPVPPDYSPVIRALAEGDYFVTSGEVLIPEHSYTGAGADAMLVADVEWTFPLDFVEVVHGDGETTSSEIIAAADLPPFGRHTFRIPFDATGRAWVRFAAWDSAGNGAMTMPVRIRDGEVVE